MKACRRTGASGVPPSHFPRRADRGTSELNGARRATERMGTAHGGAARCGVEGELVPRGGRAIAEHVVLDRMTNRVTSLRRAATRCGVTRTLRERVCLSRLPCVGEQGVALVPLSSDPPRQSMNVEALQCIFIASENVEVAVGALPILNWRWTLVELLRVGGPGLDSGRGASFPEGSARFCRPISIHAARRRRRLTDKVSSTSLPGYARLSRMEGRGTTWMGLLRGPRLRGRLCGCRRRTVRLRRGRGRRQ